MLQISLMTRQQVWKGNSHSHLGASTEESEDNCAMMAVKQLVDYMDNGNIINSVNFPNCDAGKCTTKGRITILHRNIQRC